MKKRYTLPLLLICISALASGCSIKKDDFNLEKIQKIEVASSQNPETILQVINNNKDVKEFTHSLKIDKWKQVEVPSKETEGIIYKMYQEDTIKLGQSKTNEKEMKQVAAIITYKDSPYVTFIQKKLAITFKLPKDAAKHLSRIGN
ncbi:hypothetical protein [Bacillus sp. 1P06AnD]|uniref:hypothetical protein n=1 Tax=Bacillus sp. 1P06AnD TaxID=3132208 RepID=UPI0039A2A044